MRKDYETVYQELKRLDNLNKTLVPREEYESLLQENQILNNRLMEAEQKLQENMDKLTRFDEVGNRFVWIKYVAF